MRIINIVANAIAMIMAMPITAKPVVIVLLTASKSMGVLSVLFCFRLQSANFTVKLPKYDAVVEAFR